MRATEPQGQPQQATQLTDKCPSIPQIKFIDPEGMQDPEGAESVNKQLADIIKAIYENATNIPLEDEEEDENMGVDKYPCHASHIVFCDGLKDYGIIGRTDDNTALLSKNLKMCLLKFLAYLSKYIASNTDKPAKSKNEVTKCLKLFDDMPYWGLLLQILLLQGLYTWFECLNFEDGDSSINDAQSFLDWLTCALLVKLWNLFQHPSYNIDEEKQQLKHLYSYLYSTEAGKAVQDYLQEKYTHSQPEGQEATLMTDRAKEYFSKAIDASYMIQTDDGYNWTYRLGKGNIASLAYFLKRVYDDDNCHSIPFKALGELFNVKNLSNSMSQVLNAKKPQQWRGGIDNLFDEE